MTGHRGVQIQDQGRGEIANGRLSKAVILVGTLLLSLAVYGQTSSPSAPATNVNGLAFVKLPVAHAHFGSFCRGYLTISPEGIRYDTVGFQGKEEHSFALKREEVVFLNYWFISSQRLNAVEIRSAGKNYHFWLMRSVEQLQFANWRPVQAAPSDILLLSLYYWKVTGNVPNLAAVRMALAQARAQAANASMAQAQPAGNAPANNNPYDQMSQHIYSNMNSQTSITNQINSISHMSHW